jgi:tetratricopeptide (TPR) repeat protein
MGRQGQLRSWSDARACAAAWALLCAAASIALAEPAPAPAGERSAERSAPPASAVAEIDALLRAARFEEAAARSDALREELGSGEALLLRAQLEVAAGTAYVALEREDAARECFRRALSAEPALDLDPAATSPKVLRVFRSVRAEPRRSR